MLAKSADLSPASMPSPLSAPSFRLALSGQAEIGATEPQGQRFHRYGGQASLSTMISASLNRVRAQQDVLVNEAAHLGSNPTLSKLLNPSDSVSTLAKWG